LLFAEKKKKFLSWHHTLARGWPTIEITSAYVPMVVFYRLVSQFNISWWAYVIIRPESLSVEGQELDFVHVSMHIINKNINTTACRPTMMNE
jgi:hypothetical protein